MSRAPYMVSTDLHAWTMPELCTVLDLEDDLVGVVAMRIAAEIDRRRAGTQGAKGREIRYAGHKSAPEMRLS